ncbi:MAG: M48 family metallopeptidase [Pontiellaceae bacterium]|jgi:predicted Zn-dependent protease|nr:M48 family metallopeptidase [Pontiellaceae bacterium]
MKILSGLLCLLLLTGCATDAVTGKKTYNFSPLQKDVELGSQIYSETAAEMKQRGIPVNADPVRLAQLKEMVRRISAVSDLPDLPYEVMLIQTNIVNAMAAPGGKLIVYEGLWNPKDGLVQDDNELAAVLAHEIAHVNCRHSTEAMSRTVTVNLVSDLGVTFAKNTKYEKYAQLAAVGGVILYDGLLVMCYSRTDEKEADAVGLMYMAKAGYDPRAALRIWERSARNRNGADPAASIFSTHPPDAVRLENLRKQLPAALTAYEAGSSR